MSMALKVLLHHSYAELFGTAATIERLRQELEPYRADRVILLCAYINFMFEWLQFQPEPVYADLMVASAFPPAMAERLIKEQRPVFHRRQCLLIAKEAARCACGSIDPTLLPSLGDFGRIFLMANDLFYRDLPAEGLDEERAKLLVNWVGLVEYLTSPLKDALVRSDRVIAIVEAGRMNSHQLDVPAVFQERTGITPAIYRDFCIAVLSFYIRMNTAKAVIRSSGVVNWAACCELMKVPANWLAGTTLTPADVQRCSTTTIAESVRIREFLSSYDQGIEDFTVFRKYPLFANGELFALVDSAFLVEKCETGVFWAVHEALNSKRKKIALSYWGEVVEQYVNWLFSKSASAALHKISSSPQFDNGEQVTDIAITCNAELALVECKGGFFGAPAKYSGNADKLKEQIRIKLIENAENKPKGVRQLANAINALFGQESRRSTLDTDVVNTVFPILLVRDDIGAAPAISLILAQEFEAQLKRGDLRVSVKPLIVISVRVLEFICRYLSAASLTDILNAWVSADPRLFSPFWLVSNQVIDKFGPLNNQEVDNEFHRIVKQIAANLFPSGSGSQLQSN